MKKIVCLTFILSFAFMLIGQGQNEIKPRLKVSSFSFNIGFAGAAIANTTEEYNNLKGTVNNPDLFIDASDFQSSRYNYGFGGNINPKVYIGITPYSNKKGAYRYDRELRFSFGSGAGIRKNFNYYKYDSFIVDTFQSINNENVVYSDSNIYNRFVYMESYYDINFGVSFLFKTPVERRFHFSTGAGLEYGIALRSYVKIDHYMDHSIYYYNANNKPVFDEPDNNYEFYNYSYDFEGSYTTESTNIKGTMQFVRAYLPLGIHFRISNKTESFFNQVYLYGEMSPGIEFQIVGNDKTYVNPYFGMALFGFSYRW
ncbi:hypothetical protein KQH26_00675 [bacterium]|nr:hypothetical protein [bacterium]